MNRTLRILARARADVEGIFIYLVRRSPQGAIAWYLAYGRAVEGIGSDPESFALAPEADRLQRAIRQALFKTRRGRLYRIVFEILEREIVILRVRGPGQAPLRRKDVADE
jgi:plasmid stabilization system protein ParE